MNGESLRFYVEEDRRYQSVLIWEWLLEQGNALGIRGGSAFRSIGGFGRRHEVHESRFFELAGATAIMVEFLVDAREAEQMIECVTRAGVRMFFVRSPSVFGEINAVGGSS